MPEFFSEQELEAYLDETLDAARAADLERAASLDASLIQRLAYINSRRNAGVHTLGEIWRRHQVAVPSRDQVADWLGGKLPAEEAQYLAFRLNIMKCRYTQALVIDVQREQQSTSAGGATARRDALFQKGANLVERRKPKR